MRNASQISEQSSARSRTLRVLLKKIFLSLRGVFCLKAILKKKRLNSGQVLGGRGEGSRRRYFLNPQSHEMQPRQKPTHRTHSLTSGLGHHNYQGGKIQSILFLIILKEKQSL